MLIRFSQNDSVKKRMVAVFLRDLADRQGLLDVEERGIPAEALFCIRSIGSCCLVKDPQSFRGCLSGQFHSANLVGQLVALF
jgi:hypothetical protein